MLAGKRFKLDTPTVAIEVLEGRRVAVTVPSGTTVEVIPGLSDGERMIDVMCEGRRVMMFAIDLNKRGTELND